MSTWGVTVGRRASLGGARPEEDPLPQHVATAPFDPAAPGEDLELVPRRRPDPRPVTPGIAGLVTVLTGVVLGLGASALVASHGGTTPADPSADTSVHLTR